MSELPNELPEKPVGWTKNMTMHLNFGRKGGLGAYQIRDAQGNEMPIRWQYDTREGGLTGFFVEGKEEVMTWNELRQFWPEFIKARKESNVAR